MIGHRLRRATCVLLALLLPTPPALAKGPPQRSPGIVSAADPRAAAAGAEMLRAGGSAADAAIATMMALTVVEPQSSGIGGGGFFTYSEAASGRFTDLDGRETAPAAADGRWFFGADGRPMSHAQAVPGGRSVGVPGQLRLAALAHKRFGKLAWARLFAPAIRLADGGFAITPRLFERTVAARDGLLDPWAAAYLRNADGSAKPVGTVLRNPALAALFRRIAVEGPQAFYAGATAQALVAAVNGSPRNPSKMNAADLAVYAARPRGRCVARIAPIACAGWGRLLPAGSRCWRS